MALVRLAWLGALGLLLSAGPAAAEIADFYGIWSNNSPDASGIAKIIVTPGDGNRAEIHLFGRCQPTDCDWGVQRARVYSDNPSSFVVRSIAADFSGSGMYKRVVLRAAVGHILQFAVQTDFAQGSGRADYATNGIVAYAGDWNVAPRVAAAPPPATVATVAAPTPTVPLPAPVAPPENVASNSGPSFFGVGTALASGYVPAAGEDCRPFDPKQVRTGLVDGHWRVGDFASKLLDFGPHQAAARTATAILDYYHFDEQCFVAHGSGAMLYWKRAGQVPNATLRGEDCTAVDPATVTATDNGDGWRVVSGGATLLEYDERGDAERAVSVIRTYKLSRQCFFARSDSKAQYWLAR